MHPVVDSTIRDLLTAGTYSQIDEVIHKFADGLGFLYVGYQYWPGDTAYGDDAFCGVVQCNYPDAWQD
jgi:hypothetical protein